MDPANAVFVDKFQFRLEYIDKNIFLLHSEAAIIHRETFKTRVERILNP